MPTRRQIICPIITDHYFDVIEVILESHSDLI